MRARNTRGRQVVDRLNAVERQSGRDAPELAEWFADGEHIASLLQQAMHGEIDAASIDERPVREWQAQGRSLSTPTHGKAALGAAIRKSGLSPDEAASALSRAINDEGMTAEQAIHALAQGQLR
jgi:hypothetical protein